MNAFKTDSQGKPLFNTYDNENYEVTSDNVDPRLFHTVGMPGFPYKYNEGYLIQKNDDWSRSKGLYGYYVSLKENVDPDCDCLKKGSYWASSLNHIVIRYADVLLMRAEALIQLNDGRIADAISLINDVTQPCSRKYHADLQLQRRVRSKLQSNPL